ncbi:(d)CMP kinase [Saprospiraceae bacterium]|nr:(d)CMP kinase [Saprospiraceae bacterium]
MKKNINIAIDGHSSCGKSTLAKDIAKSLSYIYIDSGAMYRAVALYVLNNNIDLNDEEALLSSLDRINIEMKTNRGQFEILLNGEVVTERIIAIDVSSIVSEVAAKSSVRKKLVKVQQQLGQNKGVVMDGRDIGTVVYPNAEVKFFVTADVEVRTQRRYDELQAKGMPTPYDEVKTNLTHRDGIDSTRKDSPLVQASDAILIDNSYMGREEQLFIALKIIKEKISA